MKAMRVVSLVLVWAGCVLWGIHARGAELTDLDMQLTLEKSLVLEGKGDGATLFLDVRRVGGVWERVWGEAPGFNKSITEGLVVDGTSDAEAVTLSLSLLHPGDAWVKGGRCRYEVELKRASSGDYIGTYKGAFRDLAVQGRARAVVGVPKALRAPVALGEHPRLMFRKADVPALREKAKTPFGQAALAKLDGVIGKALKYQLTGDKQLAEGLIPVVEKLMDDTGVGDKMVRGRILGWRFEQIALAYDLCYDAWPEAFRRRVESFVAGPQGWRAFKMMWTFPKEINWNIVGTYPAPIRYGPALAAVAVWGEKGAMPEAPVEPFTVRNAVAAVAPAAGYKPGAGVPVMKFADNVMPNDWLALAGVKAETVPDPATARPEAGAFRLLSHEGDNDYYEGKISITTAAGRRYFTTAFFYTVLDNEGPRWVRVSTGNGGVKLHLNGERLADGDVVRLEKGLYPIMVVAAVAETSPWGREQCQPRFVELTEADAKVQREGVIREHAEAVRTWKFAVEQHKRLGGANVDTLRLFELSNHVMRQYYSEGFGSSGYMAASLISFDGPDKYAVAYRNAFGRDVLPRDDVSHFLARKMFTLAYGKDNVGKGWELDGVEGFHSLSIYGEPGYDLAPNFFGTLYPLTPAGWQSAVLWGWQKHAGFTGADGAAAALAGAKRQLTGYPAESHVAWTFVNYPLEGKATAPAGVLPLNWRDDAFGWFGFRNAWKDGNDFVAQFYLRQGGPGGEDAGAFRLTGLGQRWALGGNDNRLFENVVQLPDDTINGRGRGRLLHHSVQPDGSGVVTVDLGDVYAALSPGLYEVAGRLRIPENLNPSGITGLRSLAVDYSGKCGAPCLLVIVDKVVGAKRSAWSWPVKFEGNIVGSMKDPSAASLVTPGKARGAYTQAELKKVHETIVKAGTAKAPKHDEANATDGGSKTVMPVIEGKTFTLDKGNARLRGTLVTPGNETFGLRSLEQFGIGGHETLLRYSSEGVVANGQGEYMVVITIGAGEPPAVKVAGEGLNATVTVGSRHVRFDGEKVLME